MSDPDLSYLTPKNNKLKRTYAIADIAAPNSDAAESEHEPQALNDEYEPQSQPESPGHLDAADEDDEPTPKKKQKMVKVPVREAINANRKEHNPAKAEDRVSHLIVIDYRLLVDERHLFRFVMTPCAFSSIVRNQPWNSSSITRLFSIIISVLQRQARRSTAQLRTGLLR